MKLKRKYISNEWFTSSNVLFFPVNSSFFLSFFLDSIRKIYDFVCMQESMSRFELQMTFRKSVSYFKIDWFTSINQVMWFVQEIYYNVSTKKAEKNTERERERPRVCCEIDSLDCEKFAFSEFHSVCFCCEILVHIYQGWASFCAGQTMHFLAWCVCILKYNK